MRLLITGAPRTGKTTHALALGAHYGAPVYHTDDTKHLPWSDASLEVSRWLERPGPWIIEGVAVPRALRKWLRKHPEGAPADELHIRTHAFTEWTRGQRTMARGIETVLREIMPELAARGVVLR